MLPFASANRFTLFTAIALVMGAPSAAYGYEEAPEAMNDFATCPATSVDSPLQGLTFFPALTKAIRQSEAPAAPRYAFTLPDGQKLVLNDVKVSNEADAEEEHSPQLMASLLNLPEDDGDMDAFDVAGRGSRPSHGHSHFTNRGILSPSGKWPVSNGGCATITGQASFYGGGEKLKSHTASGKVFNAGAMAAANRTLPLGARVTMTNLSNGASVSNVVINDRGPAIETGRLADVTLAVAQKLQFVNAGHTQIQIRVCRGNTKGLKVGMN